MKFNFFYRIFTVLITVTLFSCSGGKSEKKEIIRPVRYEKVFRSGANRHRTITGVSKAGVETNLSFKVSGNIEDIPVKIGQVVKKGALIASLDDTDYQLQLDEALVSMNNAEIQEQTAKSSYERISALYENGNVSLSEYEQSKTQFESARAMNCSAQKRVEQFEKQISYTRLYAPMNGIIGAKNVEKNENVQAGTLIVQLNSGDELNVIIGIPDIYISQILPGQKVIVDFPSISDKKFKGEISEVSYIIDERSSTYPVTIIIAETSTELRPGMAANVSINLTGDTSTDEYLIVPSSAVAEEFNKNYVFVAVPDDEGTATVRKIIIETGRLNSEGFEVISGLEEDDMVITAGLSKLTDGMKVKLIR